MKQRECREAYILGAIEAYLKVVIRSMRTNLLPDDMLADLTGITQAQLDLVRNVLEEDEEQ